MKFSWHHLVMMKIQMLCCSFATEHFYDAHSDFPSENQKMHSIFCGRHTGRPYDVNDGYAPNAFP
jgi:hypothetical protein